MKTEKTSYRIQTENRRIKYAGTGFNSWFTLEDARKKVDYANNERIIEHDGMNILWEVF